MKYLSVAAFEPGQRYPGSLDFQGSELGDAIRVKAQLLNGHARWTTLNPRGGTFDQRPQNSRATMAFSSIIGLVDRIVAACRTNHSFVKHGG